MNHDKPTEFSKKIIIFTGIIFTLSVLYCIVSSAIAMFIPSYSTDWTSIVTLLTVTGGAFGSAACVYYQKAREENKIKIKSTFLKDKYEMLNKMGVLTLERARMDMEDEINKIDSDIDAIETSVDENGI